MKAAGRPDGGRIAFLCRNIPLTNLRKQLGEGQPGSGFIPLWSPPLPLPASGRAIPEFLLYSPWWCGDQVLRGSCPLGAGDPTDAVQLVQSCPMPSE